MELTKYEKAKIIGSRALQITMGAPFLTEFKEEELKELNYDATRIALEEFERNLIKFNVKYL